MECPFCSFDNIEGVDQCARCQADLSDIVLPVQISEIERELLSRPLGDLVTQNFIEVGPDTSVRDTLRKWTHAAQHCTVVTDEGKILGILTERDVLNKLTEEAQTLSKPVSAVMTAKPEVLDHTVPIAFGINRMMLGGYRHIPIERDERLSGVVSVRDVLRYLAEHFCDSSHAALSQDMAGS